MLKYFTFGFPFILSTTSPQLNKQQELDNSKNVRNIFPPSLGIWDNNVINYDNTRDITEVYITAKADTENIYNNKEDSIVLKEIKCWLWMSFYNDIGWVQNVIFMEFSLKPRPDSSFRHYLLGLDVLTV